MTENKTTGETFRSDLSCLFDIARQTDWGSTIQSFNAEKIFRLFFDKWSHEINEWRNAAFLITESVINVDAGAAPENFYNFTPSQLLDYALPKLKKIRESQDVI